MAVLGLAVTLPPGFAAGPGRAGVAPVHAEARFYLDAVTLAEQPGAAPWVETRVVEHDLRRACAVVEQARAQADGVVIQIHWGMPHGWCGAFQGPLADRRASLLTGAWSASATADVATTTSFLRLWLGSGRVIVPAARPGAGTETLPARGEWGSAQLSGLVADQGHEADRTQSSRGEVPSRPSTPAPATGPCETPAPRPDQPL